MEIVKTLLEKLKSGPLDPVHYRLLKLLTKNTSYIPDVDFRDVFERAVLDAYNNMSEEAITHAEQIVPFLNNNKDDRLVIPVRILEGRSEPEDTQQIEI